MATTPPLVANGISFQKSVNMAFTSVEDLTRTGIYKIRPGLPVISGIFLGFPREMNQMNANRINQQSAGGLKSDHNLY